MARLVNFGHAPRVRDDDSFSDAGSDISKEDATVTSALLGSTEPLAASEPRQRAWFARPEAEDPDAIATQPSVYDDPDLAEQYWPRPDW